MTVSKEIASDIKDNLKKLSRYATASLKSQSGLSVNFKVTTVQNAFSELFGYKNFSSLCIQGNHHHWDSFNFKSFMTKEQLINVLYRSMPEEYLANGRLRIIGALEHAVENFNDTTKKPELTCVELELIHEMVNLELEEFQYMKGLSYPSMFTIDAKSPLLKTAGIADIDEGNMFNVRVGENNQTYTVTEIFNHIYTGKPTLRIEKGIIVAGGNGRISLG